MAFDKLYVAFFFLATTGLVNSKLSSSESNLLCLNAAEKTLDLVGEIEKLTDQIQSVFASLQGFQEEPNVINIKRAMEGLGIAGRFGKRKDALGIAGRIG